jgi:DNA-binding transcriptional LysR family regulator
MTRVRQTMHGLADGQSGLLNVAAMPGPVSMLFPRFIARHLGDRSDIRISMLARSSNQIAELARAQSIDFGFADAPVGAASEDLYDAHTISADCFLAIPAAHPLAAKAKVTLGDLDGIPLGSLQPNHATQREITAAFRDHGLTHQSKVECQTFLPILQFVLAGQCCLIVDPLTVVHVEEAGLVGDGMVIRPMERPFRYAYAIFTPRHRPMSVASTSLRRAWVDEVVRLLDMIGAAPEMQDQVGGESASS